MAAARTRPRPVAPDPLAVPGETRQRLEKKGLRPSWQHRDPQLSMDIRARGVRPVELTKEEIVALKREGYEIEDGRLCSGDLVLSEESAEQAEAYRLQALAEANVGSENTVDELREATEQLNKEWRKDHPHARVEGPLRTIDEAETERAGEQAGSQLRPDGSSDVEEIQNIQSRIKPK